jgi:hypothetical protein
MRDAGVVEIELLQHLTQKVRPERAGLVCVCVCRALACLVARQNRKGLGKSDMRFVR